ncbi:LEA type 2 family protein [Hydrogenimonas sp. SS33]|uniref:LEA type 2 family protein n=1 Tax=Hydrogenimonas leucolamina TaxID=2954236 RepID=UPI00336BDB47
MKRRLFLLAISLLMLTGCSGLQPKKPELSVGINTFKMVPGDGLVPKFEIGLHVVNTSPVDVHIKGVVYKVYLEGRKVLVGAANHLPEIPAYSERELTVTGSPDLFETLGFFKDLMGGRKEAIRYVVDVVIDTGSFLPMIHTKKEGTLNLAGSGR